MLAFIMYFALFCYPRFMCHNVLTGNEPDHQAPFLYPYIDYSSDPDSDGISGAAWKSQKVVRNILLTMYDSTAHGLAGMVWYDMIWCLL